MADLDFYESLLRQMKSVLVLKGFFKLFAY